MRRTLAAVALAASLAAPAGPFERLWGFLSALWDVESSAPAPTETKSGCGMDPDGLCKAAPAPQVREGCGADPNGWCDGPGS